MIILYGSQMPHSSMYVISHDSRVSHEYSSEIFLNFNSTGMNVRSNERCMGNIPGKKKLGLSM